MRKYARLPHIDHLNECFKLQEGGKLMWKLRPKKHFGGDTFNMFVGWNKRFAGLEAGSVKKGYLVVGLDGKKYMAHRIIFYISTEINPMDLNVDHADRNTINNDPCNLRLATHSQNSVNKYWKSPNSRGVTFMKRDNIWTAWIYQEVGKKFYLGSFASREEAVLVATAARIAKYAAFYPKECRLNSM